MSDQQKTILTLTPAQCKLLFPQATHRHYKGGLYQFLCVGKFTETDRTWMLGKEGPTLLSDEDWAQYDSDKEQTENLLMAANIHLIEMHMVVYRHIFPHPKEIFIRPLSYFYGQSEKAPGPHHLRFEPLHPNVRGAKRKT